MSYYDNINAGTGYVDITGLGNYKGVRTLSFEINKKLLDVNPTYSPRDIYYEYQQLPELLDS